MLLRSCKILLVLLGLVASCLVGASEFGHTVGHFSVSSAGSAGYTIPIWVPPGVAGLTPKLALSYSSNRGDGLLGVGWGLAGLSAISRCNLTYAQDGVAGSPQLTATDRFCLDGNRLRITSGTYGAAGATYQTEIANFSNITSNGTAGTGPAWFSVQGKDGLTYQYGNTTDSAILAVGTTTVNVWALNAVLDRNGNAITFTYTDDTTNGSYRIASIQYTCTGSSLTNYGYSINFTYQTRSSVDPLYKFTVGGVDNQFYYLTNITVDTVSGTTLTMVHGYELTFGQGAASSRLRIASVQECGSSTSDCYPMSSITYQDGQTGWGSEIANSGNAANLAYALPIDVNGDGIDDLVYPDPTSGHWYYELGTSSGAYLGPYDTGIASTNYQSALAIDFYVTGSENILVPNSSGYWRVLKFVSAGAAFSYVDTTTSAAGVVPGSAYVADIDGDGRQDLVYAVSGGSSYANPDYIYYRLNTGGAFSTTQSTLFTFPNGNNCSPCTKLGNTQPFGNPGYRFTSQVRKLDFNGDGRGDLLVYLGTCDPIGVPGQCGNLQNPITYTWTVFLSQPNGTYIAADAIGYTLGGTPNEPPLTADFNGDGCTDLAYTVGNIWYLRYGTCGRSGTSSVLSAPVNTGLAYGFPALAIDWDGDGRADIVEPGTTDWGVLRSTGNNLTAWADLGFPAQGANTLARVADLNGSGMRGLIYSVSGALKTRVHSGVRPDLATAFADGYGVTYSPTYVALSQASSTVYTKGSSQVYPQQDFDGPLMVTQSALMPDGIGGTYTKSYAYSGAVRNLQGRGLQGFTTVQSLDSRTGFYDTKTFSTGFLSSGIIVPTSGMLTAESVTQTGGTNVSVGSYTLAVQTIDSTSTNQRYFPYITASSVNAYEVQVGGSYNGQLITNTATNYGSPDNYGNFSSIETTVTDEDSGSPFYSQQWTTTTANTITANTASWCLSLPTEVDVTNTAPGVPAITRHTSYVSPDYVHCRQTQQVVESGSSYQVSTVYSYADSFGNLTGESVTGFGMVARTTSVNFGATGQFPIAVTNALGQISTPTYDPATGQLLSLKDPNGIVTSWQYDSFARKVKETRPDGTSTTWALNNCTTAGCVNSNNKMTVVQTNVNTDSSTLNISNTYLDSFDRPLVTSKQMLSGAYDRNEVQYNNYGSVAQQAAPCTFSGCTYYWTVNTYDQLNRLTQSQRPISASNPSLQTTTINYSGRTKTVTDAQNKVTTTITKVTGKLGRTQDNNGYYVNFKHDAFGAVLSATDSLSNPLRTMTYAYGLKAYRLTLTDMDLGTRTYTPDALGEVTSYSDGKGQPFSAAFDAISRMTSRTEPDLTTTWTWGTTAANYNIGKLASVSSVSPTGGTVTKNYYYDSFGRASSDTTTLPTVGAFTFNYFYNTTTGLIDHMLYPASYPAGTQVPVGYGFSFGILSSIYNYNSPTNIFWSANTTNPRGQITQETMEDLSGDPHIVSNHVYDAVTGWLTSAQAGPSGGSALQNESYLYDELGNVAQRQNNNLGLTENFFYDNLYRLDHSTLGGSINLQMGYDAMGNIASRSDVAGGATWTYDPTHKHQVTQAGSSSFTYAYDANGNATSRNGSIIGWTSYNYPSGVGTSTESATFDYGPDRQRWRMIYTGPSGTETTYYVSPMFEAVKTSSGTDYRHYVFANGKPVQIISRTTAFALHDRSLLLDHQGSISTIVADNTGTAYATESFTAYGNRREASTWSGAPTSGELTTMNGVTREGYTFQTVLGSMGLNHMNGRIEDSVTGRFLSADPHGIVPTNTQSFNRYSFVSNNPLSFTDPSGFTEQSVANVHVTMQRAFVSSRGITGQRGIRPVQHGIGEWTCTDPSSPCYSFSYSAASGNVLTYPDQASTPNPGDFMSNTSQAPSDGDLSAITGITLEYEMNTPGTPYTVNFTTALQSQIDQGIAAANESSQTGIGQYEPGAAPPIAGSDDGPDGNSPGGPGAGSGGGGDGGGDGGGEGGGDGGGEGGGGGSAGDDGNPGAGDGNVLITKPFKTKRHP
jgi:RHS repeat-associated protein